jgi:hypothetical protein
VTDPAVARNRRQSSAISGVEAHYGRWRSDDLFEEVAVMGFLSRRQGKDPTERGTSGSDASLPECRVVRGREISVGRVISQFAEARLADAPAGLLLPMKDFVLIQGELSSKWGEDAFLISADRGPCRLVCAGCDAVFSEQFVFSCGSNSAGAAFGLPSHTQCPSCGSGEAIIAYLPDMTSST